MIIGNSNFLKDWVPVRFEGLQFSRGSIYFKSFTSAVLSVTLAIFLSGNDVARCLLK